MDISMSVLDTQIQRLYLSDFAEKPESLRCFLLDSPTQYSDVFRFYDLTEINFKTKRRQDFQRLSILSWYFPEEIRILVQLSLKELWDKTDQFNLEKEVLLLSKELCLAWVLWESGWSESSFFGNVLNKRITRSVLSRIGFKKKSRSKVRKYTGYCRGYQDTCKGAPRSFPADQEIWVLDHDVFEQQRLVYFIKVQNLQRKLVELLAEMT